MSEIVIFLVPLFVVWGAYMINLNLVSERYNMTFYNTPRNPRVVEGVYPIRIVVDLGNSVRSIGPFYTPRSVDKWFRLYNASFGGEDE